MQKSITTFFFCFILAQSFGQTQRKTSLYLQGEFNKTTYDQTKPNNPWGMGLGLQLFLFNNPMLKPTVDFTADAYLEDDKVLRLDSTGEPIATVRGMVNLFAGASFHPAKPIYVSFVAGPSFVGGQTLLGIKPSIGFYFSSSQKCAGKISYINVFNRGEKTKQDFSSISFSLGVKLF